ncbi:MAG: hypothetical protein ACYDB4_08545 [Candidatus Dormibacteraceae bacterium]
MVGIEWSQREVIPPSADRSRRRSRLPAPLAANKNIVDEAAAKMAVVEVGGE